MISKLVKNEEDIFLQTTTDAVINKDKETLTNIIATLEERIKQLEETVELLEKKN